jgi:hypothetical protein
MPHHPLELAMTMVGVRPSVGFLFLPCKTSGLTETLIYEGETIFAARRQGRVMAGCRGTLQKSMITNLMDNDIKNALKLTLASRQAYRAKIEALLDKSRHERLADVWQRACPFPIGSEYELPDRRGIIADLTDFAEVLQPNLEGMQANRLCRLIEKYAACGSRQSELSVSLLARRTGTLNNRIRVAPSASELRRNPKCRNILRPVAEASPSR